MNTRKLRLAGLVLAAGLSGAAHAALHDRGGGLIYDDVLNVTWLQDANYAKTSGYDDDGLMTWDQAVTWAASLTYYDSVRKVTHTDWRLPTTNPVNGISTDYTWVTDGSSDFGYNISALGTVYAGSTASELAYMYYVNLGNPGHYTLAGTVSGCYVAFPTNTCLDSAGPFTNLSPSDYWSDEYQPIIQYAWSFSMGGGLQSAGGTYAFLSAWAVSDGDVAAIPEPETYAMMLAGLGLVGTAARRRRG